MKTKINFLILNHGFKLILLVMSLCLMTKVSLAGEANFYDLKAVLTDQDGQKVNLDTFRGHPVVVSMFYSSCQHTCPLLIGTLKKIEAQLKSQKKQDVKFLMISFDPERDTREVLDALVKKHNLDLSSWKLAATNDKSTAEIAAALDVRYRKTPEGEFSHTNQMVLVDRNGVMRASQQELSTEAVQALLQDLASL